MTGVLIKNTIVGMSLLAITMVPNASEAGCRCSKGKNKGYSAPASVYQESDFSANYAAPAPVQQRYAPRPQQLSALMPQGTLGRTYYQPSREIPADKHPRIGMIDVVANGATDVSVYNINPHREEDAVNGFENQLTNGLWQFETKPLIPGVPHIYKVVFRFSDKPNSPETVRYVRMIPGRIVQLTY